MPSIKNQEGLQTLIKKFKLTKGMILTHYHGLSVSDISDLRSKLRPHKSEYLIVKNTISELALRELGFDAGNNFVGPTAIVFQSDDIVSPAKIVSEFAKVHENLKVKAAFLDGKFVGPEVVIQLSSLPSKEVLIVKMLGSMNAPISGFVNVLSANIRWLLTVLNAISKKQSTTA